MEPKLFQSKLSPDLKKYLQGIAEDKYQIIIDTAAEALDESAIKGFCKFRK